MEPKRDARKQDGKSAQGETNGDDLQKTLSWVLNDDIFAGLRLHGNVKWTPLALVRLAIFWVWSPESSLVEAANGAIAQVMKLFGGVAVGSYQALTGALQRYTPQLLPVLWARLQCLMRECDEAAWRVGRWLPLAIDGSRIGVPRTRQNERRFCKPATKRGRKTSRNKKRGRHAQRRLRDDKRRHKNHHDRQPVGPQMWLTLMWHIGLRLPWCWRLGPSYASEREHVLTMLHEQQFPENTLFCGDAGFMGYEFWRAMIDQGHHFLIRVGSNVHLLKGLGVVREYDGIVYCWPTTVMEKNNRRWCCGCCTSTMVAVRCSW